MGREGKHIGSGKSRPVDSSCEIDPLTVLVMVPHPYHNMTLFNINKPILNKINKFDCEPSPIY